MLRFLALVASKSEASRKASVDLAKEPTRKLFTLIQSSVKPSNQTSLAKWLSKTENRNHQAEVSLTMPRNIKWDTLERIYNFQPQNYEELLAVRGVGPATVRGLHLLLNLCMVKSLVGTIQLNLVSRMEAKIMCPTQLTEKLWMSPFKY
jgi:hypothetical protein